MNALKKGDLIKITSTQALTHVDVLDVVALSMVDPAGHIIFVRIGSVGIVISRFFGGSFRGINVLIPSYNVVVRIDPTIDSKYFEILS